MDKDRNVNHVAGPPKSTYAIGSISYVRSAMLAIAGIATSMLKNLKQECTVGNQRREVDSQQPSWIGDTVSNTVEWKACGPPFLQVLLVVCEYLAKKEAVMEDPSLTDTAQRMASARLKDVFDTRLETTLLNNLGLRLQTEPNNKEKKDEIFVKFDPSHELAATISMLLSETIVLEGGKWLAAAREWP